MKYAWTKLWSPSLRGWRDDRLDPAERHGVRPSHQIASIGTGARWLKVLSELEKEGVSVTGGREGVVGVGGFLLGGGNSWYTARTGLACDSVVNYELVLVCGTVINANASANSDLWRALKGGGSNFGIFNRFDLETFPARNLSRATRTISPEHMDAVIDAIAGFTDLDRLFHNNAMLTVVSYNPEVPGPGISINVTEVNTMGDANSTAFDEFNHIPTPVTPYSELKYYAQSANSTSVAPSIRNAGSYLTLANDRQVMRYCIDQHASLVTDFKATLGAKNFRTILEFQPMPAYFADIGLEKGGNMLGLERDSRNKLFFVPGAVLLGTDTETQLPWLNQLVWTMNQRIEAFSKSIGRSEPFRYLNYAKAPQDMIGSYGAANLNHIKQVADKYDRHCFFQRRIPGGFKVDRAG